MFTCYELTGTQLLLFITQYTCKAWMTATAVRVCVYGQTGAVDTPETDTHTHTHKNEIHSNIMKPSCVCAFFGLLLVPITWVVDLLVTQWASPSRLTLAAEGGLSGGMTPPMSAHTPLAGLAAGHHSLLQQELSEVLELVINVEVSDTAVETRAVPPGALTQ